MARSLGLAAYRALARRQPHAARPFRNAPRPKGELLWAHATTRARYSALCDLSLRLRIFRPELQVLISMEANRFDLPPVPLDGCDHIAILPSDHPSTAQEFLAHWSPDLCLWAGADLMPNLIGTASDSGIPMLLLDIDDTDFPFRTRRWLPDPTRTGLNCFNAILANSDAAAAKLRRLGVSQPKISVNAPLRASATPPSCSDEELNDVTRDIANRPVWLAAHLRTEEFDTVLAAHRAALRLVHRLLLIVVIDDSADAEDLKTRLADLGLYSVDWDTGDVVEDVTQVVFSRDQDNLGLWFRVAPLTFMGGSLTPHATESNPLEPAALGSAVLYGPHVQTHAESYARLAAAGAARNVRDGDGMGSAVLQLIAPDHAAAMALAGWDVVTEHARMTDILVDTIQDFLDLRGGSHAPA
ncbi:glycosyltransferase N-terminal domain-containing protein [Sedimentitalea sp. JM2-8]|uniref:3-deoxy-D-manno-octulosonic acid transferase n=1 Tax=Sedimentitalea xiamensis TaxID=3050037 RepID=A0ABT7F917_9RHOB|nr:glycosyltransferase N-terminal domain-containing protein [Sedimentitalea xiamensis]MDK3071595.1 glycosyltransferase N-terminal domain-containing protein [Sedimentitalea xiamensis]